MGKLRTEMQTFGIGLRTLGGDIVFSKKEEEMLLSRLNIWYDAGISRMEYKIKKWSIIRNYLRGSQWGDQTAGGSTAANRVIGNWSSTGNVDQEQYSNNVLIRIHMSNMQRLGRFTPIIEVDPNDNSIENKQAARFSEVALYDWMDITRYENKTKKKINRIITTYGGVYSMATIDPDLGGDKSEPILDDLGNIAGWNDQDHDGTVRHDIFTPRNVILPPNTEDIDTADWVILHNVRTTDYVLRRYGVAVKPDNIRLDELEWWKHRSTNIKSDKEHDGRKNNLTTLKQAWIRRSEDFPMGGIIVWSGTHILKSSTLEDFYDDIPIRSAQFIYDDEDPDGETPYWFMIPMQDSLNRVESDIRRHVIMMTKPKWQLHSETQLEDPDGITNETAQVLKWTGKIAPSIIDGGELPQTVFSWRDMVLGEMMSLGAAHDIIRPDNSRSGTAIAYEQEQDDTVISPTVDSIRSMMEDTFIDVLKIMSQYYLEEREISMRAGNKVMISKTFSGADLEGNFKVRVNMQSGLPANKIARQQMIIQLVNNKIITPDDAKEFFEFGKNDDLLRALTIALERSEKIISMIETSDYEPGGAPVPHEWENHEVMLKQFQMAMQERWEEWPEHVQTIMLWNFRGHKHFLMPPPPMDAGGPQLGTTTPAEAPLSPPGVPASGQDPQSQPSRDTVMAGDGLVNIPGLEGFNNG